MNKPWRPSQPGIYTVLLTTALLGLPTAAIAAEAFSQQWQQPLQLTLPEPTRGILLESMVDPQQWLTEQGIENAQLLHQGRRTLAQFAMSDEQWAQKEAGLCGQPGVAACDPGACKTIQFRAQAAGTGNGEQVKARIIRTPPDVEETGALSENGGLCATRLLPPLTPAEGGTLPDLTLDLDLRHDRSPGRSGIPVDATPASTENLPATEDPAATNEASGAPDEPSTAEVPANPYTSDNPVLTAADFQLRIQPDFSSGASLASDQLPADTTGYTLLVGEGCQAVQVPLSSVAPAHVPNLITAVVTGDPAAIGLGHGLTPIKQSRLTSTGDTLVVFHSRRPVAEVLTFLRRDPSILLADREHIFTTTAAGGSSGVTADTPGIPSYSDPFAAFTYGPANTGALALHSASTGEDQVIAVIDTGVALDHPDLTGRIQHEDFTDFGWSADAHGTAVAGIIAATADNGLGSYGVAPGAEILALKACQPRKEGGLAARCWTSSLVKALDAALQKDAQIINMSLAGPPDAILQRYVELAVQQNRLVVAGAGNGGSQALPAFPAAIEGVLAVTAVDVNNRIYALANQGDYIDLAAPGVDIITASPGDDFPSSSGTSWAAAHVSGIAALLKPLMPLAAPADIAFVLRSESTDLGRPGKDPQFGYGIVNACAAAAVATGQAVICPGTDVQPDVGLPDNEGLTHEVQFQPEQEADHAPLQ